MTSLKPHGSRKPLGHLHYLEICLREARKSPPKPTNFCVGACLVSPSTSPDPLITGYTLECEGNTHAEQCCFIKLAHEHGCSVEALSAVMQEDTILYTTMEPCNKRSIGNTPCVDRILALKRENGRPAIATIVVGVMEPETFVGVNAGKAKLEEAGIEVIHASGLEKDILEIATAGHVKNDDSES